MAQGYDELFCTQFMYLNKNIFVNSKIHIQIEFRCLRYFCASKRFILGIEFTTIQLNRKIIKKY